ncbi:hypothetical protein DAEQUDRAFT_695805, partial [Daedalea quercina L-15889]
MLHSAALGNTHTPDRKRRIRRGQQASRMQLREACIVSIIFPHAVVDEGLSTSPVSILRRRCAEGTTIGASQTRDAPDCDQHLFEQREASTVILPLIASIRFLAAAGKVCRRMCRQIPSSNKPPDSVDWQTAASCFMHSTLPRTVMVSLYSVSFRKTTSILSHILPSLERWRNGAKSTTQHVLPSIMDSSARRAFCSNILKAPSLQSSTPGTPHITALAQHL